MTLKTLGRSFAVVLVTIALGIAVAMLGMLWGVTFSYIGVGIVAFAGLSAIVIMAIDTWQDTL